MLFQETERTELKRVFNDSLPKEIVAFLNSFDGTVYIGVEDDGTVVGVNNLDLIVNTATKCGFTPQYDELEKLYEKYHAQGFEILDFPCNQFGQQAPGTDESIHEFCKLNFGTEFPRFKKIKVNGDDADPLYKFLQEQKGFAGWDMNHKIAPILDDMLSKADPDYKQKPDIKWNFTKFLINKKGQVVARFEPTENIDNIAKQIEELL